MIACDRASRKKRKGPLLSTYPLFRLLLLLPLSAGPSLEHYRTEYLQGASEAWLKTGKSDLKTDKNIPQLYLVVTGQPCLEGLQGWRCDDTLW